MSTWTPIPIGLRPANPADERRIFRWRNLPAIVALGSSGRTVTLEEHRQWFARVLASPEHQLTVIELDGKPAGLLRFDRTTRDTAVISIYLLPEQSGRGAGSQATGQGCRDIFQRWKIQRVLAMVRQENAPALKMFQRVGFQPCPPEEDRPPGHVALQLMRTQAAEPPRPTRKA